LEHKCQLIHNNVYITSHQKQDFILEVKLGF